MDTTFDTLPTHQNEYEIEFRKKSTHEALKYDFSIEAYRSYACAALTGAFNLPDFKDMLTEIAHPDCDNDRYVAIARIVTEFVGELAAEMELQERRQKHFSET